METCYRIQPIGADLHAVETLTSNDKPANGVHVFGSRGEVALCQFWCAPEYRNGCELVTIECEKSDLRDSGDAEGYTLKTGRGRIARRDRFNSLSEIVAWSNEIHTKG